MFENEVARNLASSDREWDTWVTRAPHDFYHLAAYHRIAENMGEGEARLAIFGSHERFVVWPYLIRPVDGNYYDGTSVYGYATPTGIGITDGDFMQRAWTAFRSTWRDQNLVSMFTRFHPMIENHELLANFHGELPLEDDEVICPGRSVSINIAVEPNERRSGYSQSTRRQLKIGVRNGAKTLIDESWERIDEFVEIYLETMNRNQASDRYYFPRHYFESLRDTLPGKLFLGFTDFDGMPAATMLFSICGPIAQMHLVGMRQEFQKLYPNKLLIDTVCEYARSKGAEHLHLGAGRGGFEDSLFEFKTRFSKNRHNFCIGRWVLNDEAYLKLSRGKASVPGFFPAYRALDAAE